MDKSNRRKIACYSHYQYFELADVFNGASLRVGVEAKLSSDSATAIEYGTQKIVLLPAHCAFKKQYAINRIIHSLINGAGHYIRKGSSIKHQKNH